jgi:hypothetical protein
LLSYDWGAIEWVLANSFSPKTYHVHSEQGFGPDEAEKTLTRRDLFRRFSLRNTDVVLVPSLNLKILLLILGISPRKKSHIYPMELIFQNLQITSRRE